MSTEHLPRPYQLVEYIAATAKLTADYPNGITHKALAESVLAWAQELAVELWKAGQIERRAGMGTTESEYDAPLWCRGRLVEEITDACGVPTVAASDPAKDLGRGRGWNR